MAAHIIRNDGQGNGRFQPVGLPLDFSGRGAGAKTLHLSGRRVRRLGTVARKESVRVFINKTYNKLVASQRVDKIHAVLIRNNAYFLR